MLWVASGGRVRNASESALVVGDNVGKLTLIPHTTYEVKAGDRKASRDWMSRCRIS